MVADAAAALAAVFQHLDRKNSQELLLAIGRRPDTVEKVQRFQALEILSHQMFEGAIEGHRRIAAEWAQLWTRMAKAGASSTWQRLGRSANTLTPANDVGEVVLPDFMADAELMGLLGLEAMARGQELDG